jgi:hypothetical protein
MSVDNFVSALAVTFVHLADVLERKGVVARPEFADGLRETANLLPPEVNGREGIAAALYRIADGVHGTEPHPDNGPLLRLVQGGKADS